MFTNPTIASRIKEAIPVLKNYFDAKSDAEQVIATALEAMGVDDSEMGLKILGSDVVNAAEFDTALRSRSHVVPGARVKIAMLILQGIDPFQQTEHPADSSLSVTSEDATTLKALLASIQQNKPIGQWSDLELLEKYGKDCSTEVECELLKRTKGRPAIIFKDDETVDVEASLLMIRQARHRETPSTYAVGSSLKSVYKVGDFPMNIIFECPVHSGILLTDGYCEECGIKWLDFDVNKDKYIFLRLVSDSIKIDPVTLRAHLQQPFEQLTLLYPKVFLRYTELKEEGKLPTLRRRLSKTKEGDPFRVVHTQY